jgi:hypothetical protein
MRKENVPEVNDGPHFRGSLPALDFDCRGVEQAENVTSTGELQLRGLFAQDATEKER